MTFLVVDDFETMRQAIATQLHTLGVERILTAKDGAEALRILRKEHIDVVLSDWVMPVMSGLDLLKALRADESLYKLPFVMITAEAERERIKEAIAWGVSSLVVKPYTAEGLTSRIEQALNWKPHRIPAAAQASVPPTALASEPKIPVETRPPSILVVDDLPENQRLLSALFQAEYRVSVADHGTKALEICCSDDPPDLVLLDVMMPDMDGFEVARRMRGHPSAENIPVIFVTALSGEDDRLKGLELGAVDFISKPINFRVLKQRVKNFMRYVELRQQLQADYDGMLAAARLHEDVEHITRHDLKGPLAGIMSLVQALTADEAASGKQIGQLRMIEETALQMLNMINRSSELVKIETGRYQLDVQRVNIVEILKRIAEIAGTTFAEKHLTITVDTDVLAGKGMPQALGDAMLCYSLFQNLLKNACEAAPANSRVTVMLYDKSPLRILIENRGAVPAEIRETFFDKFVTQGKEGGTGLGTYSAKLLAEVQGGHIELAVSDAENSTSVTVVLPRVSGGKGPRVVQRTG